MKRLLQLAALVVVLAFAGHSALAVPIPQPTYCGEPCSPNGAETGCRCWGPGGVAVRKICYCLNGTWV